MYIFETATRASDGVKGFEDVSVQVAFWMFGGLVPHEAVDEAPRCRRGDNTGEWRVEEIRVLVNRLIEACSAVLCKERNVVAVVVELAKGIQGLKL